MAKLTPWHLIPPDSIMASEGANAIPVWLAPDGTKIPVYQEEEPWKLK